MFEWEANKWIRNCRRRPNNIITIYMATLPKRGSFVAYRYTNAPPRCRTSLYHRNFIPLSLSLWNDLADPVFDGVGLAGFDSKINALTIDLSSSLPFCQLLFPLSLLSFCVVIVRPGSSDWERVNRFLSALHCRLFSNNNKKKLREHEEYVNELVFCICRVLWWKNYIDYKYISYVQNQRYYFIFIIHCWLIIINLFILSIIYSNC